MPAKNSKPVAPKVFDVIAPGKAAPSPTGRPIIVSNRPMIKDPMEPIFKSRPITAPPVEGGASHVGRPIGAASDSEPEASGQPPDPILSTIDADALSKDGAKPGDAPAVAAPEKLTPVVAPLSNDSAPESAPVKPPASGSGPVATTAQSPTQPSDPAPAAADSIADDDADKKDSAIDRPQPGDVAAAEKASAAEKAAATERAAQEKIIASGQYYLPISGAGRHRALQWILLILVLVILLGLAWLDIAMDAGIIHIHGVQPLTHFFSNHP